MTGEKNDFEIVLTDDLRIAVTTIKEAIQRSQARALHDVNREMLSLYYGNSSADSRRIGLG